MRIFKIRKWEELSEEQKNNAAKWCFEKKAHQLTKKELEQLREYEFNSQGYPWENLDNLIEEKNHA